MKAEVSSPSIPKVISLPLGEALLSLEFMDTFRKRRIGLLEHNSLDENKGAIFKQAYWIHSFRMRFPILILGLDKELSIICAPVILDPNCIIKLPKESYWVAEIHPSHFQATLQIWRGNGRKSQKQPLVLKTLFAVSIVVVIAFLYSILVYKFVTSIF